MRGRRPQPTKLKILRGNPGKRDLPDAEPDAPAITDEAPPLPLEGIALREWESAVVDLKAMGLLSQVDRLALAGYCEAFGEFAEADAEIKKSGRTFTSKKGMVRLNPMVGVKNQASLRMKAFAIEFGFTPSSRSKVKVPKKTEKDAFEALMAKKRA